MNAIAAAQPRPVLARELLELTKPRITALNLIAAAAGFGLARGGSGTAMLLMLLGTSLVVGAANSLNCYLERDLDKLMARTRGRPLPAGRLSPQLALAFGLALAAVGVPILTFGVNPLSGLIATSALVGYVLVYTPLKQVSSAALLVGAVPGAAPPLIGWAAATGHIELPGLLLFVLLFLWQVPHFLAITLYRLDDYARAGMRVLPLERGEPAARRELVVYAAATVATSLMPVVFGFSRWIYLGSALILGALVLAKAFQGLRQGAGAKWARAFFMTTNLYLTLLLGALMLDRFVRW
jgi:protoheme IX farnesyltransferase